MKWNTYRAMAIALIAALVSGLLVTCSAPSAQVAGLETFGGLRLAQLPTSEVLQPAAPGRTVLPAAMPQLSQRNVTPQPTAFPLPTPLPEPPTPTMQSVGPGGLPFPPRTPQLEFGAHAHLFWTNKAAPLTMARGAGFGWIRQQIHWRDQEGQGGYAWGSELDELVDDVNANGMKLMLSIVRSPTFYGRNGTDGLPEDPNTLGNFVAALVTRYKGRVQAIQIWNEQNLAYENGGYVSEEDAGHYVEILKVAYTRIKEVDPTVIVVSGAPASTSTNSAGVAISDVRYYDAMFRYQNGVMRNYVDALGVHPGGSANPPETLYPAQPSAAQGWTDSPTFYFRNIENVRKLMLEYSMDQTPVWITEFGWATHNTTPGFEFGEQVSLEQQADYIVRAMRYTKEHYAWVDVMILWNLNFAPLKARDGDPLNEQASFGILNADYSPRPAYTAIQQYIRDNP